MCAMGGVMRDAHRPGRAVTGGDQERGDRTPQTITDRGALAAEFYGVRRRGFATLIDEFEPGLRAVAVPVADGHDDVLAALAVSGPSARLPRRRLRECAEILSQASVALTGHAPAGGPGTRSEWSTVIADGTHA